MTVKRCSGCDKITFVNSKNLCDNCRAKQLNRIKKRDPKYKAKLKKYYNDYLKKNPLQKKRTEAFMWVSNHPELFVDKNKEVEILDELYKTEVKQ